MATWTPNSESTFLVAKPSPIGGLAAANRPVTSGPHGGQLHCELKPGKWTKRYVVLQNQAIYLCANDKVRPGSSGSVPQPDALAAGEGRDLPLHTVQL